MPYDRLLKVADYEKVEVYERQMSEANRGLYGDGVIWINKNIPTTIEKTCVLAEELGHYYTSAGDILDQEDIGNRRQELRARSWAYIELVSLEGIVEASLAGVKGRHEIAEYLEITESFLSDALTRFQEKYGHFVTIDEYTISFDPLYVLTKFE